MCHLQAMHAWKLPWSMGEIADVSLGLFGQQDLVFIMQMPAPGGFLNKLNVVIRSGGGGQQDLGCLRPQESCILSTVLDTIQ